MGSSPLETVQALEARVRRVCTLMVIECARHGIDPNDPAAVWQWAVVNWPGIKTYLMKQKVKIQKLLAASGPMA